MRFCAISLAKISIMKLEFGVLGNFERFDESFEAVQLEYVTLENFRG